MPERVSTSSKFCCNSCLIFAIAHFGGSAGVRLQLKKGPRRTGKQPPVMPASVRMHSRVRLSGKHRRRGEGGLSQQEGILRLKFSETCSGLPNKGRSGHHDFRSIKK